MPMVKGIELKSSKIVPLKCKMHDKLIENSVINESKPVERGLPTSRLLTTCAVVALVGGFHFGFQLSVTIPRADALSDFVFYSPRSHYTMTTLRAGVIGALFVGAILGASFVPKLLTSRGCRTSLIVTSILMITSIIISLIVWLVGVLEWFIVSRLLTGISIGMGMTVQSVLISELSPDEHRGSMGMLTGLFINAGIVVSSILGVSRVFGGSHLWSLSYFIEALPCLVVLVFAYSRLEESPLYHLKHCHDEKARESLLLYYGTQQNTDLIIKNMKAELGSSDENEDFMRLLKEKPARLALLLAGLINLTVGLSGVTSISVFGPSFMGDVDLGTNGVELTYVLSTLSGTAGALLGSVIIDKIGRRPLLIGGAFSLASLNVAIALLTFAYKQSRLTQLTYVFVVLYNIFQFTFATTLGSIAWFIGAELSGPLSRSRVTSAAISMQYFAWFLSILIYSPLEQLVGPFSSLLFVVPLLSTCLTIFFLLPETKNKSMEEIQHVLSVPFCGHPIHLHVYLHLRQSFTSSSCRL
ncbi:hypothetical protein AB6A40_006393 [Gnathostoma spinigerum]|uniref:Major facilitator superfamily (MFS) profile domain-containing protein n=1 Tax=Gnathostoma spinigerum TaxID=75299 RepID=A0ABD6EQX4_9BILA